MKRKILIVEDADISREILKELLEEYYDVIEATNGREAIDFTRREKNELSAVLLDLRMPGMDGFQVCETLQREQISNFLPILVLTSDLTLESEIKCFDLGCYDYIRKPFSQGMLRRRIAHAVTTHDRRFLFETDIKKQNEHLHRASERLQGENARLSAGLEEMIGVLGSMGEYRHVDSGTRVNQLKEYTRIIVECYRKLYPEDGLTETELEHIVFCSPLHDIGKIEIPERVIEKPGKLTGDEFELIKSHAVRGSEMIRQIHTVWDSDYARECYDICKYHHERYDGNGYPDGLSGESIPLSAQIVGIVDVYDALINDTPYRKAIDRASAFEMIVSGECGAFSPKLLETFLQSRKMLEEVR